VDAAPAAPGSADELASALMAAPAGPLDALWGRSDVVSARELAWSLKRACDAAWTTDPASTRLAAERLAQLAARHPHAEVDALAAWTRGIALLSQGEAEPALGALDAAATAFAAGQQAYAAAQTRVARVMALALLGRYDDAIACGTQARAAFDAAGDARAAGKVELNIGNLAAHRDHHDAAAVHYTDAAARFVACGDVELELMAVTGLADMLTRRHDLDQAEQLYRQARERAEGGGYAVLIASIDGDLGALEMRRGRFGRALELLERSRRGYAALDLPHVLAVAEQSLADAYLELNLLPEALALYERSLGTFVAAGLATDRAWALSQRARVQTLLGRHAAAAASLDDAERAFEAEGNTTGAALVQVWRAELALKQRDFHAAVGHARAAEGPLLEARQLSWHLQVRCLLAEALRECGDVAEAGRIASQTARAADRLTLPPAQRRARQLMGLLARDRGDAAAARRCFVRVVESIESQRGTLPGEEFRAAFLGDNLLPYQELVRASLEAGGARAAEQALHWVERARARSLADEPAHAPPAADEAHGDPAPSETERLRLQLGQCYRALSRPLADGAPAQAQRLLDEVQRIEATLLEAGRRSAAAGAAPGRRSRGKALDMAALHARLGTHSALVEYFSLDDALLACVVAAGAVRVVRLPARMPEVRQMVEQLRFQTDSLRRGAAHLAHRLPELRQRTLHHLQQLHAGLWAPLAPRLEGRRAVVVPHGVLHYLPFEALHDGERHEIERRELCRAPSAAVLLRCLQRPTERFERALVIGHADERLPHVAAELQAVAARFGGGAQLLHDDAARGDALRAAAAGAIDVLHIACHAQFRHDSPRFSALHLADGAFTVRDAAALRLQGGLVTLSACETGISAVMPGDELIGLTHAFIAGGAARVLASLWAVQDESAAMFMQGFYDRLRAGAAPGRALRETQIDTMRTQPHPYTWAPFTLHGGW
jgi:CHAT domain-containing protein